MYKLLRAKKALIITTIIIIAINVLIYFTPFYRASSPYDSVYVYLYYDYMYEYPLFTAFIVILPIVAITLLLTHIKDNNPFAFAFTASIVMYNILLLLSVNIYLDTEVFKQSQAFGFILCVFATAILGLLLISLIVIHGVIIKKFGNVRIKSVPSDQPKSNADAFTKKIEVLDSLKANGSLTQNEYDQKRSEIINDLKL